MRLAEVAAATDGLGWRLVVAELHTQIETGSLVRAAEVAARVADVAGEDAGRHLRLDVRAGRLYLALYQPVLGVVAAHEVELARAISAAVADLGLTTAPGSSRASGGPEPTAARESTGAVQLMEMCIDAMDIPAIRPFWKAVLDYADEPGHHEQDDPVVDPDWRGPAIWFQQMDAPRPQRNRIHFDIRVPRDEAPRRIEAAVAAGGRVTYAAEAPAFWVLADPEGNEVCVCTWEGRGR